MGRHPFITRPRSVWPAWPRRGRSPAPGGAPRPVTCARPAGLGRTLLAGLIALAPPVWAKGWDAGDFITFESGQVRPLALSDDGRRLYAVNTPDARLEVFAVDDQGLHHRHSVPVGLEPVAVALHGDSAWVVNHLSDSVSVVTDLDGLPRVSRTLQVGDEPRDIVFAGAQRQRAFITTAHRGQHSPWTDPADPGEFTTPGRGRADVWVFEVAPEPRLETVLSLFTDTPRALAVSPDRGVVYAAGFLSGNRSTVVHEEAVCDGGAEAGPCHPNFDARVAPGGLPAPDRNRHGARAPESGLVVQQHDGHWLDAAGRRWDDWVRFELPDHDVFAIDANASPPRQVDVWSGVGTVLYNLATNPVSGALYVSNTEARNLVRFEGARPAGSEITSVAGQAHLSRITVIEDGEVRPRHLNKHLDYAPGPVSATSREASLALPTAMAVSADGQTLYLAAYGSASLGIFDTTELAEDQFTPDAQNQIRLSAGGPSGIVLDPTRPRAYVLTRFNNAVAVIDLEARTEIASLALFNPEPPAVVAGRPLLYDARYTSANGEQACASCHVFADLDALAWDLGNPLASVEPHPGPFRLGPIGNPDFHPLKGPMTTQSLRGLADVGPMHWRGDRHNPDSRASDGSSRSGVFDERAALLEFNRAFVALNGRERELDADEMQRLADFLLQITYPPNPVRALDNRLNPRQQRGRDFFFRQLSDVAFTCEGCHQVDPDRGHFGTDGAYVFDNVPQHFKVPQLRNLYQKVGMFGMPDLPIHTDDDGAHLGPQVRGTGFNHDGATDTIARHLSRLNFFFFEDNVLQLSERRRRDVEQYLFAFETNLAPAVGQQTSASAATLGEARPFIALLEGQAAAGACELVVHGVIDDRPTSLMRRIEGHYQPARCGAASLPREALEQLIEVGRAELTWTCVPRGTARRMALDRDRDGVWDGDDADSSDPAVGAGTRCGIAPNAGSPAATFSPPFALFEALRPLIEVVNRLLFGGLLGALT